MSVLTKGKISVIMALHNCEKTVNEAIDSILKQSYTNWELIMCDDASGDNTYTIANDYVNKYPDKMILLKNENNMFAAFTRNRCLSHASGEFVAIMDGDDISQFNRFEKQIAFLNQNPSCDLVGTAMQRFSEEKGLADVVYPVVAPDYYTLRKRLPFLHGTILAYKCVFDELGGYVVEERTRRGQDYDLFFRFYHAGFCGCNLQEPLYLVRENKEAIRRRTFRFRLNATRTAYQGFKLLGYPSYWMIRPIFNLIVKSIVPFKLYDVYREMQARRFNKKLDSAEDK